MVAQGVSAWKDAGDPKNAMRRLGDGGALGAHKLETSFAIAGLDTGEWKGSIVSSPSFIHNVMSYQSNDFFSL